MYEKMLLEKQNSKIASWLGIGVLFIAFTFRNHLWNDGFYHLLSASLVSYLYSIFNEVKEKFWKFAALIPMLIFINIVIDELLQKESFMNWNEVLTATILVVYLWKWRFIYRKFITFKEKIKKERK